MEKLLNKCSLKLHNCIYVIKNVPKKWTFSFQTQKLGTGVAINSFTFEPTISEILLNVSCVKHNSKYFHHCNTHSVIRYIRAHRHTPDWLKSLMSSEGERAVGGAAACDSPNTKRRFRISMLNVGFKMHAIILHFKMMQMGIFCLLRFQVRSTIGFGVI